MRHIRKGGVRGPAPRACSDPDVVFDRGAHNRTIGNRACGRNGGRKLGAMQAQIIDEVDLMRWWPRSRTFPPKEEVGNRSSSSERRRKGGRVGRTVWSCFLNRHCCDYTKRRFLRLIAPSEIDNREGRRTLHEDRDSSIRFGCSA
jgi:hypothetical protein